jgi:5-methylcytosine-specific restriction endonuclease McrA
MFSDAQLTEIFGKTKGHCHFCGDALILSKYAISDGSTGAWEIDHVIQKGKGGTKDTSNCLPACIRCNRLRWHRTGDGMRDLLLYGLIAKDEIKKGTDVGRIIKELKEKRLATNRKRRRRIAETQP